MKRLQVFLVEDDELFSFLVDHQLSEISNFIIRSYTSGEAFLGDLSLSPDIVIMDYNLPGMDGKETLKKILHVNPDQIVIFLSGDNDPDVQRVCLEAGAYDYLVKDKDITANLYRTIIRIWEGVNAEESAGLGSAIRSLWKRVRIPTV